MSEIYKNKSVINQRGASIDIDNTTDKESISISQRSGSNLTLNNLVNSELASNNKQTNVINDLFETVGKDKQEYTGGDITIRNGENSYTLKGFRNESELNAYQQWKDSYKEVADLKSQFKIKRGGESYPNGTSTELDGERADNPVINSKTYTVENDFSGYSNETPERRSSVDEVATYVKVPDSGNTNPAQSRDITEEDIEKSAGQEGSSAPGVVEFGADKSGATENGEWVLNQEAVDLVSKTLEKQAELSPIEQQMGNGGDDILYIKRNKFEQVGAVFNDYPSVRIDDKGRSQPFEMLVSDTGTYKNHDYVPHVEEVDNGTNFPGGEESKIVGNRYNLNVGSGGINMKSTGPMEMGGSTLKAGYKKVNINASHGIHIGSENGIEIQSIKTVILRTNRQVYVESSLGVKNNLIVGGGASIEGETYLQHVTAPLEVQQTEDTTLFGQFATDEDRKLLIGECQVGGVWYPVFAKATPDLIENYPHSHHFNNLPLRLTKSNKDVRGFSQSEGINTHNNITQSLPQNHEKKLGKESS